MMNSKPAPWAALIAAVSLTGLSGGALAADALANGFGHPPDSAKPWVYWYFMDGNLTREGMTGDLEAMKKAGIGGGIFLEVNLDLPRGPVDFMSPEWQGLMTQALHEADRLGIQIALGSGPGWCGTGGPWITPELAMQHLVASETNVTGPMPFSAPLAQPRPRTPYFGESTLTPELKKEWQDFYRDVAVIAFPTPDGTNRIAEVEEKALYHRDPYSSMAGVKPFLPAPAEFPVLPTNDCINPGNMVELTSQMAADGRLVWDVPAGRWTIMRLGRTLTGQTTRPAPQPGLGFESDKFDRAALDAHFAAFIKKVLVQAGPHTNATGGLTMLHFDSWEMGSQNWSPKFREEFQKRRGYDPLKFLPAFTGRIVTSPEISERFLWDVRRTAQELLVENHVGHLAELAHQNNLTLSIEPYDLNPAGDLTMGRVADVPQCEFWHLGFDTLFSVVEAASIGHTCGRPVVAAEAFTSLWGEDWKADPAALKPLGDWAFCSGVNRFDFHRFQAQPWNDRWPGMTMGPFGVHWDRTQTWWDMVPAYHEYLARCQFLLQRGVTVADICFLAAEGAPEVFRPPSSAVTGSPPDHSGYNFDGCAPETLVERAGVRHGNLVFPGGTTYRMLVLPEQSTMTPKLLHKIESLVRAGATVFGPPPVQSPSLEDYPQCDAKVKRLAQQIWGDCDGQNVFARAYGKGRVLWRRTEVKAGEQYGDFAAVTNVLAAMNLPPDFVADGPVRFTHRRDGDAEIYFVANASQKPVVANGQFRVQGLVPQVWNPLTGEMVKPAQFTTSMAGVTVPLALGPDESAFVIFRRSVGQVDPVVNLTRNGKPLAIIQHSPAVIIQKATYGVPGDAIRTRDVKEKIQTQVGQGKLDIQVSDLAMGDDPASGVVKTLRIEYTVDGQPAVAMGLDTETVTLATASASCGPEAKLECDAGGQFLLTAKTSGRYEIQTTHGKNLAADIPAIPSAVEIRGPWEVRFDPKWEGPERIIFESLDDWSQRPEKGIKYYSGTAVYRKSFAPPELAPNQKWFLDLGMVKNLARVRLNGHDCGVAWCPPWRVEITTAIANGTNELEIEVANLWPNRLIGDQSSPASERLAWTTHNPYTKDSPLLPSGLLGPVALHAEVQSRFEIK
jgi:hypothetical protein